MMFLPLRCFIFSASVCFLFCLSSCEIVQESSNVVFIILSQSNHYHERLAEKKKVDLVNQVHSLGYVIPEVYIVPKDFPDVYGYWTIFPIFQRLTNLSNCSWLFFCEETTHVSVKTLLALISSYNATKNHFLGYALKDKEPTIIHHFDPIKGHFSVAYPDFAAGFLITYALLKRASSKWINNGDAIFSIDAKYELAKFLWENGAGTKLVHEPRLCLLKSGDHCATWFQEFFPECGVPMFKEELFFAVKTCEKFHKSRVQVVKNTWANDTGFITFFSDVTDPSIPTVNLGIENVPSGHCDKTLSLIRYVTEAHLPIKWLVVADDDTLISVPRLQRLLSCYTSSDAVALGERYGFGLNTNYGYDYITGGGGMVFSMAAIKQIASECSCPSIDSPDDMILGMCLQRIGIPVTHSIYFHQARPTDYNSEFLNHQKPVSFHKHWMNDPYKVYKNNLQDPKPSYFESRTEL